MKKIVNKMRKNGIVLFQSRLRGYPKIKCSYKKTLYARNGVQEYWIVNPEEKIVEVMTLGEAGFESCGIYGKTKTLKSSMFPGLTIKLSEVF